MQPVGDLDQAYPYIVRQGQEHFFEILRLFGYILRESPFQFGQPVHHRRDFGPEMVFDVFDRIIRVFHHIVQERRHNRFYPQPDFHYDDPGNRKRMRNIRLPGMSFHPFMRLIGEIESLTDTLVITLAFTDRHTPFQQFVELLLHHQFILIVIVPGRSRSGFGRYCRWCGIFTERGVEICHSLHFSEPKIQFFPQ